MLMSLRKFWKLHFRKVFYYIRFCYMKRKCVENICSFLFTIILSFNFRTFNKYFPLSDIGDQDFNIETCRSLISMYDVSLIITCTHGGECIRKSGMPNRNHRNDTAENCYYLFRLFP